MRPATDWMAKALGLTAPTAAFAGSAVALSPSSCRLGSPSVSGISGGLRDLAGGAQPLLRGADVDFMFDIECATTYKREP